MKTWKRASNEYIPLEVLTQILANLPAKSVLKFRCVCKSWYSIISDPDFVYMHLQLCNTNPFNSGKLVALEGLGKAGFNGSLLTVRKAATLCKTGDIFKYSESYYLHGSCNSLILICSNLVGSQTSMRLCNPSIRKSLLLPPCPLLSCSDYNTFVLGYALHTKDFKLIAISYKHSHGVMFPEMHLAVYTLSDQLWTLRDNCLKHFIVGPYYFCEGAAHCLGRDPNGDYSGYQFGKTTHLVSLDFDTETFTFLELPYAKGEIDTIMSPFLLMESLAFFCISPVSFKIWVLKQKSGKREWNLWFSGPSCSKGYNMFRYRSFGNRVLYHDGDGGSLLYGNKSFNIATCQVRSIGNSLSRDVELCSYYESLVLCKGYGAEDMPSLPFAWISN